MKHEHDKCPDCGGNILEAEFGLTSEAFLSDESVSGIICEEECGFERIYDDQDAASSWDVVTESQRLDRFDNEEEIEINNK